MASFGEAAAPAARVRAALTVVATETTAAGLVETGAAWEVDVELTSSCDALRVRVAKLASIAPTRFWLVYRRRVLEGAWCLGTFGVRPAGCTVRLVPRAPGAAFSASLVGARDAAATALAADAARARAREAADRAEAAASADADRARAVLLADAVEASLPRRRRRGPRRFGGGASTAPPARRLRETARGPWTAHPWASDGAPGPSAGAGE